MAIGIRYNRDMQRGVVGDSNGYSYRGLKMSREEVKAFLAEVRKDINNRRIHAYLLM
jgi:hypothetical protein